MKAFTKAQKIVLIILAVADLAVIGTVIAIIASSILNPPAIALTPEPTQVSALETLEKPTWTPTVTPTPRSTLPARATRTPTLTPTSFPTHTPAPPTTTPTPSPILLVNPDFDMLLPNRIPGWEIGSYVNYKPSDGEADPETSYAEPFFAAADDAVRTINGSTVKVETMRWLKFRAWAYQSLTVTVGSTVYFEFKANAYSSYDRLIVKAGIDPTGQDNCYDAQWGAEIRIRQEDGIVIVTSPRVTVPLYVDPLAEETETPEPEDDPTDEPGEDTEIAPPPVGRITVCIFIEPTYPHVNNAAFFDQADVIAVR